MKNKFIIRRIAVSAVAFAVLSPAAVAAWSFINRPTFSCVQGEFTLVQGDTLSARVPAYCDGLMADAISWVIETNKLEDIMSLQPGTTIIVKEVK